MFSDIRDQYRGLVAVFLPCAGGFDQDNRSIQHQFVDRLFSVVRSYSYSLDDLQEALFGLPISEVVALRDLTSGGDDVCFDRRAFRKERSVFGEFPQIMALYDLQTQIRIADAVMETVGRLKADFSSREREQMAAAVVSSLLEGGI